MNNWLEVVAIVSFSPIALKVLRLVKSLPYIIVKVLSDYKYWYVTDRQDRKDLANKITSLYGIDKSWLKRRATIDHWL